ncbi:unnamed protein product [Arctogadus glacialis]
MGCSAGDMPRAVEGRGPVTRAPHAAGDPPSTTTSRPPLGLMLIPLPPCETVPRLSGSSSISSLRREPPTRGSLWPRQGVHKGYIRAGGGWRRTAEGSGLMDSEPLCCEKVPAFKEPGHFLYCGDGTGGGEEWWDVFTRQVDCWELVEGTDVASCALPRHDTSQGINIITRAALNNKSTAFAPLSLPLPFQSAVI